MNRFIAVFLLLAVAATGVFAFSVSPSSSNIATRVHQQQQQQSTTTATAFESSTAMHMAAPRIKIDPNKQDDDDRLNPAVFKNALYLGSIAFAVLLPIFFLVASQK
jgi:hypothetical protein